MTGGVFTCVIGNKTYQFARSSNIASDLNEGYGDVGFIGSDKIDEAQLGGRWMNLASEVIARSGCTLVAATNELPIIGSDSKIATSFPNLTRRWLGSRLWPQALPEIVLERDGGVEGYIGVNGVDTIVDIRESGQSLIDNKLNYYEGIEPVTTKLVWNEAGTPVPELDVKRLYAALARIRARKLDPSTWSQRKFNKTITQQLFSDPNELVKKFGSEGAEWVQDFARGNADGLVRETQDVIFPMAVGLESLDRSLIEALNEL